MESLLPNSRSQPATTQGVPTADGILTLDTEGTILSCNPAAASILGYQADALVGKPWTVLIPPESQADYALRITQEFCSTSSSIHVPAILSLRQDSSLVLVDLTLAEIRHQETRFFTAIFREVSVRAANEARSALLAAIVDSSWDAVISQTKNGVVTSWNRAATLLLGYTSEDAIGRTMADLGFDGTEITPYVERVLAGERLDALDMSALRKDGSKVDIRLTLSPVVGENRRILGVAAIARDRTEHQSLCAMLEASEAVTQQLTADLDFVRQDLFAANRTAQQAAKAKEEFLANMSHELRTPLNAILGFAEILCGEQDLEKAPSHRSDALKTILRSGTYLLQLIDNILELSKLETGDLEIKSTEVEVTDMVKDVIATMKLRTDDQRITLSADIGPRVPIRIQTDPRRVKQILVNLISNAIKFTPRGEVKLLVRRVSEEGESNRLAFDVVDTGIGIAPRDLSKIFEPFSQVDFSTTRRFGGTGLGLAISQRLAKLLGGRLTVKSAQGVGSTFTLTVEVGSLEGVALQGPTCIDSISSQPTVAPANGKDKFTCRILVVEDAPDNQRLVRALLQKLGAVVEIAENGLVGYDKAIAAMNAGRPYDLVLMDMQMPVMDGYEATRILRSMSYPGPIVALTAHAMVGDREKCLEAGCDDYLSKPIDRTKLFSVVRSQVG